MLELINASHERRPRVRGVPKAELANFELASCKVLAGEDCALAKTLRLSSLWGA